MPLNRRSEYTVAAASFKREDDARAIHLDPEQEWSLPAAVYVRVRS